MVGLILLGLVLVAGCGDKTIESQKISSGSESADASETQASTEHDGHDHAAGDHPSGDKASGDHPTGDHPTGDHPSGDAGNTMDGPTHPTDGTNIAGVNFIPPANWRDLGPDGMRKAQYRHGPAEGDTGEGELNVFYFGEASGGGVEANLTRWISQMAMPDGGDPNAAAERSTFKADGMSGHVVALNGNFAAGGGRPMGGDGSMLEGQRLIGVVLEGPQGSVFFKLTGPEATVKEMEKPLIAMVKDAHR